MALRHYGKDNAETVCGRVCSDKPADFLRRIIAIVAGGQASPLLGLEVTNYLCKVTTPAPFLPAPAPACEHDYCKPTSRKATNEQTPRAGGVHPKISTLPKVAAGGDVSENYFQLPAEGTRMPWHPPEFSLCKGLLLCAWPFPGQRIYNYLSDIRRRSCI